MYSTRAELKPFQSWTFFSTEGGLGDRIEVFESRIGKTAARMCRIEAFASESVGPCKSLRVLRVVVRF